MIETFSNFSDCETKFSEWVDSIKVEFHLAGQLCQLKLGDNKELSVIEDLIDSHMEVLGQTAEWLPIATDYMQQAEALVSETMSAGEYAPSVLKTIVKGRIHNFSRMVLALDRLNATATHRLESLRTLSSNGKERFRAEMYSGSKKP